MYSYAIETDTLRLVQALRKDRVYKYTYTYTVRFVTKNHVKELSVSKQHTVYLFPLSDSKFYILSRLLAVRPLHCRLFIDCDFVI